MVLIALLRLFSALPVYVPHLPSLTLALSQIRRSRWGVGSCGCGCWFLVGVARLLASSDPPLLPLCKYLGSPPPPPASLSSSPFSLSLLLPFPLPFSPPSLPSCSSPYSPPLPPVPAPVPVFITVLSLPFVVPCSSPGTTSLGKSRILHPNLLATCRRHLLSTEMMARTEWQCLVFYYAYFPMWPLLEFSTFHSSLLIFVPFPVSDSAPVSATTLVFVPAPVPVQFACVRPLVSTPVPDPDQFPSPLPLLFPPCVRLLVSTPVPVPAPSTFSFPIPTPFPSAPPAPRLRPRPRPRSLLLVPRTRLPPQYKCMYRHQALRTEMSGARKRNYVCVCLCVYVYLLKLHITAQSGPVILVILCHSR